MKTIPEKRERILDKVGFEETPAQTDPRLIKSDFHFSDDLAPDPARNLREAAVLVPIIERDHDLTVLLTRRADHMQSHAGQVAFPGGKVDDKDAGPVATALRETHEEIGVHERHIEPIGLLDRYETGTGFTIQPVVGFVHAEVELNLDPGEVAEAFEVPFDFLMDPSNHKLEEMFWRGKMRSFYEMPYNGQRIWGATAAMLVNFYTRLFPDD